MPRGPTHWHFLSINAQPTEAYCGISPSAATISSDRLPCDEEDNVRHVIPLILAHAMCLGLLAPGEARADERYRLYRIVCVPEIHYFSLRSADLGHSLGVWLSGSDAGEKTDLLEEQHGLYAPGRLQAQPFACEPLPGVKVEVSATAYPPSTGQCAGNGYDAIHISVNGRLLDTLGRVDPCDPLEDIDILIDDLAYRACTTDVPIFANGAVQSNCRSVSAPELRLN